MSNFILNFLLYVILRFISEIFDYIALVIV